MQGDYDVVGIMTKVTDVDTFYVKGEPIGVRLGGVDGPECPQPSNDAGASPGKILVPTSLFIQLLARRTDNS